MKDRLGSPGPGSLPRVPHLKHSYVFTRLVGYCAAKKRRCFVSREAVYLLVEHRALIHVGYVNEATCEPVTGIAFTSESELGVA